MKQWYQAILPKNYEIERFFEIKGFLGSFEKEDSLILYFDKTDEIKEKLKGLNLSVVSEGDWVENWRESFVPITIGSLIVVPPWFKNEGDVIINPAQGFGTGRHETTRLAIEFIESALKKDGEIDTMLDVGTGSGILSISAVKLKNGLKVVAIDNDEDALANAAENLQLNKIEKSVKLSSEPIFKLNEKYDLVAANIISSVLYFLSDDLKKAALKWLVLSGVLTSERDLFLQKMGLDDFEVMGQKSENEWIAYLLRRKD